MAEYLETLSSHVDLAGRRVLDVGCGEGVMVRWLREHGAHPVGVECNAELRQQAIAADPDHAADYIDGVGQALPVGDASFDVVIYSFSLHHVPVADMAAALREARRVLRPGGVLYVNEPALDTTDDSIGYPLLAENDERSAAQAALDRLTDYGFASPERIEYDNDTFIADFDVWFDRVRAIHPDLIDELGENRAELEAKFVAVTDPVEGGRVLRRRNLAAIARVPCEESSPV